MGEGEEGGRWKGEEWERGKGGMREVRGRERGKERREGETEEVRGSVEGWRIGKMGVRE